MARGEQSPHWEERKNLVPLGDAHWYEKYLPTDEGLPDQPWYDGRKMLFWAQAPWGKVYVASLGARLFGSPVNRVTRVTDQTPRSDIQWVLFENGPYIVAALPPKVILSWARRL